jgi:hypothetical protein
MPFDNPDRDPFDDDRRARAEAMTRALLRNAGFRQALLDLARTFLEVDAERQEAAEHRVAARPNAQPEDHPT